LGARPAGAAEDPWFGQDKALHFSASALLAGGGYGWGALWGWEVAGRVGLGAGVALGAGVGKELYDLSGGGDASTRDLAWDVVGTVTGLLVAWSIDRLLGLMRPRPGLASGRHAP
jgi:putative lipoprotein